jgi:hypothetical protein
MAKSNRIPLPVSSNSLTVQEAADSVTVGYKPVTKLQQTSSAWWSIFKSGRQQTDKHS